MLRQKITLIFTCLFLLLFFTACPEPINNVYLSRVRDTVKPVITIIKPQSFSNYGTTILVAGTVNDNDSHSGQGVVASFTYTVSGGFYQEGTKLAIDNNGGFLFEVSTASAGDDLAPITITLEAVDWNNNRSTKSLFLIGKHFDMEVSSLNKGARLSWQVPEYTAGYTIYYTVDGSDPIPATGQNSTQANGSQFSFTLPEDESSPGTTVSYDLKLHEIRNGCLLKLLLQTKAASGHKDSWSSLKETIPLSPLTLIPQVIPGYKKLVLNWPTLEAPTKYDIWRSENDRNGTYKNIKAAWADTAYTDERVDPDTLYFYKVIPTGYTESDLSAAAANSGKAYFQLPLTYDELGVNPRRKVHNTEIFKNKAGSINDIVVLGDSVYALDYDSGIHKLSLNLEEDNADGAWLKTGAHSLYVSDEFPNYLFVLTYTSLYVIDTETTVLGNIPEAIPSLDFLSTNPSLSLYDIEIKNKVIYLASSGGLWVIDAEDLTKDPSRLPTPDTLTPVKVNISGEDVSISSIAADSANGFLYITYLKGNSGGGVAALNISNPLSPKLGNTAGLANLSNINTPGNMVVRGNKAYLNNNSEFTVVDLTKSDIDGIIPNPLNFLNSQTNYELSLSPIYDCFRKLATVDNSLNKAICVAGENVYLLSDTPSTLYIVNLSNPEAPTITGSIFLGEDAHAVFVKGQNAYVACDTSLFVIDVSLPTLTKTGQTINLTGCQDVALYDNYVCLVSETNGLTVIDPGSSATPSTFLEPKNARYHSLTIYGNYAVITDATNGKLYTIDITTPVSPKLVKTYPIPAANNVVLNGDYAYITSGSNAAALHLIDISDPDPDNKSFLHVAGYKDTSSYGGLCLNGNTLYFSCNAYGLVGLDISHFDPVLHNPVKLILNLAGTPVFSSQNITASQTSIYVSGNDTYLPFIIDCYTINPPARKQYKQPANYQVKDLKLSNEILFVANAEGGLRLYSTAIAPAYIGFLASYQDRGADYKPVALAVRPNQVYTVDPKHGLTVLNY